MITFRKADIKDLILYFDWANDEEVRKNSYSQEKISLENHTYWFEKKVKSEDALLLVFLTEEQTPIGQVRFENAAADSVIIGISVDKLYRGKGYAPVMLTMACRHYTSILPQVIIYAYIKTENTASYKSFIKAGFQMVEEVIFNETHSYKLIYNDHNR
jgi:spore coat polysaccharide biosynthesis protein SpsF